VRNKTCDRCLEGELVEYEPTLFKCANCGKSWCSLPQPIAREVERVRTAKANKKKR